MSSLHALVGLAAALTNADADGRVVVDAAAQTVKFVLLNAAAHFGKAGPHAQAPKKHTSCPKKKNTHSYAHASQEQSRAKFPYWLIS